MEPGVQTPEETLAHGERFLPRLGLAAGAAAAPPRPRRALRLRLPDPAQARRQVARRPLGHRRGLHRPARLVRGLPAGRGLDRPGSDLGPARGRRPHSAGLLARAFAARRRSPAPSRMRSRVRAPHEGRAHLGSAARHQALHAKSSGRRSRRSASAIDADLRAQRRAAHQGGEPTFVSVDDRDGAEWNTDAMGPDKRRLAADCSRG